MDLLIPTLAMKEQFLDFTRDWAESSQEITPYSARLLGHSYEEWLKDAKWRETHSVNNFVTGHTYVWVNPDGRIIGALNLRHRLNDHLRRVGGHIGYGIRPADRGHGQAADMLAAALPQAWKLGLTRVLITCDKKNIGSARTIQKNGGVLENEVQDGDHVMQRYWIAL
ncbi:MAG TPA: GNAT family N-acetyltransferase [Candidatus Limiplasma sp.]|nr:GNAT family N-acetyltransferase [Candidatus Limiplasma sp.]HRX07590.1 GNAT family N-acetyltransferase [Candidatus Limiplasma sp.]